MNLPSQTGWAEQMRPTSHNRIELGGCHVEYRQVPTRSARRLRLRVNLSGVEVVKPLGRSDDEVMAFLDQNEEWILDQLKRVERLRKIRVTEQRAGEILFRGECTKVRFEETTPDREAILSVWSMVRSWCGGDRVRGHQ
jgi:predicted metal-dependent hydrolase